MEMKNFNIIMTTTHQDNFNVFKLIDSIDSNIKNIKVLLIVISQECEINYLSNNPLLSIIFIKESKIGLSKARNIALKYLLNNTISAEYIMFPDDDSSFDNEFFNHFSDILGSNTCFITPIYNERTKDLYIGKESSDETLLTINNYNLIGSPNQIIEYQKYKEHIYFDEELGVGAKYGSSEDIDLFVRLNLAGAKFIYTDKIYSFHPKKTDIYRDKKLKFIVHRFKNYSSGFALLIFRYKLYRFIPSYLIRTFGAFIIFLIRLNFKLSLAYLLQFFVRVQLLLFFFFFKKTK